jgi:hypothetical protein
MKKDEENKINSESLKAFEEFQKKRKESNLKLYKIITFFIIGFNIISLIFYIIFKQHIYSIRNSNSNVSNNIIEKENELNSIINKNEKMIVNIISNKVKFSFIFKKSSEVDIIKKFVLEVRSDLYKNINDINPILIYQAFNDGDNKNSFLKNLLYKENIVIVIETSFRNRFGFYFSNSFSNIDNQTDIVIKDGKAFLFSLDNQKLFKIKDNNITAITFPMNGNVLFEIGDKDVIIYENFYYEQTEKAKCNFPKNFNGNSGELIGNGEEFFISDLEVFIF